MILLLIVIADYFLIMYPGQVIQNLYQKKKYLQYFLDMGEQSRSIQKMSPFIIFISSVGWVLRGLEWHFVAGVI